MAPTARSAPSWPDRPATEVLHALARGELSVKRYAAALLERVDEVEPRVQAWAWLDRAAVLEQAREADRLRGRAGVAGPLAGLPVGVKDIIDVRGMPTEDGTVLHAGRVAVRDAALVRRLRDAGAWPMGKTVTTELATYAPGKTRNPHDPAHTPGGSSSGSAAAVAAGMVPLAVGTQTNGSVIRPASFCGVVGFKPTFGLLARRGALQQSAPLDHIGVFARSVGDAALLAQALAGADPDDPAGPTPLPAAHWIGGGPGAPPTLAIVRTPFWDRVDAGAREAFDALVAMLGERARPLDLPRSSVDAVTWHRTIMEADIAASFEAEYEQGRDRLSASLRGQIERGRAVTLVDYRRALARRATLADRIDALFDDIDAIVTPATLGAAPAGLESTGDPLMCTLWTLTGAPALSLPLLRVGGLPLGVQLVGRRHDEARLLRAARWLEHAADGGAASA